MYQQEYPCQVVRVGDVVVWKDNNVHRKGVVLKVVRKPFMGETRSWAIVQFDWGESTVLVRYLFVLQRA